MCSIRCRESGAPAGVGMAQCIELHVFWLLYWIDCVSDADAATWTPQSISPRTRRPCDLPLPLALCSRGNARYASCLRALRGEKRRRGLTGGDRGVGVCWIRTWTWTTKRWIGVSDGRCSTYISDWVCAGRRVEGCRSIPPPPVLYRSRSALPLPYGLLHRTRLVASLT